MSKLLERSTTAVLLGCIAALALLAAGCRKADKREVYWKVEVDEGGPKGTIGGSWTWNSYDPEDPPECSTLELIPYGYGAVADFSSIDRKIVAKMWDENAQLVGTFTSSGTSANLDWASLQEVVTTTEDIEGGFELQVSWTVDLLDIPVTASIEPQVGYISMDCDSTEHGDEETAELNLNELHAESFGLQMVYYSASSQHQADASAAWSAIVDEIEQNGVSAGVVADLQSDVISNIATWMSHSSVAQQILTAYTTHYKATLQDKL